MVSGASDGDCGEDLELSWVRAIEKNKERGELGEGEEKGKEVGLCINMLQREQGVLDSVRR